RRLSGLSRYLESCLRHRDLVPGQRSYPRTAPASPHTQRRQRGATATASSCNPLQRALGLAHTHLPGFRNEGYRELAGGAREERARLTGPDADSPLAWWKGVEWIVRMARAPRATSVVWRSRSEWQT